MPNMMVQLDDGMRSQGGTNRAKNQSPDERRFQAMIAASRRPLLHDTNMTPEQTVRSFRDFANSRRWFRFVIVGTDKSTIPHKIQDDAEVLRLLNKAGGAIGFLGVAMLGTSLQAFYKPLKRGVKVIEDLDSVKRRVVAEVLEGLGKITL
jgi:hypothetical protein